MPNELGGVYIPLQPLACAVRMPCRALSRQFRDARTSVPIVSIVDPFKMETIGGSSRKSGMRKSPNPSKANRL